MTAAAVRATVIAAGRCCARSSRSCCWQLAVDRRSELKPFVVPGADRDRRAVRREARR